jgi:hypothetical protein
VPEVINKSYTTSIPTDYYLRIWGDQAPGNTPYDTTSRTNAMSVKTSTFSGQKLPRWRSIIANGGNATTPASGVKWTYQDSYTSIGIGFHELKAFDSAQHYQNQEYFGYMPKSIPGLASVPPSIVTDVTNRCIRRWFDEADSVQSSVESGQDFGEYKQSVEALIHPLGSLKSHVLSYFPKLKKVRGKYKDATSLRKALADTYLEWTFGWKPLALDVSDAYVGLQNRSRLTSQHHIKSSARATHTGSAAISQMNSGVMNIQQNSKSYSSYSVRYKGAIAVKMGPTGVVSVPQTLQLDLPHFLPTAWDLLPYSFIADYFVNIGDIVRAYSLINCYPLWGCKTIHQDSIAETSDWFHWRSFYTPTQAAVVTKWEGGGRSLVKISSFSRAALTGADFQPRLEFKFPTSAKPWVNIAALMLAGSLPLSPFFK